MGTDGQGSGKIKIKPNRRRTATWRVGVGVSFIRNYPERGGVLGASV